MNTAYILADDFTGAHDVGLPFARKGLETITVTDLDRLKDIEAAVVVIDTNSRDCPVSVGNERVRAACEAIQKVGGTLYYKKVDSTVRGHIGQELDVIHEVFGQSISLIIPAFPEIGRTTVGGYHLLNGVPVDQTAMGSDPGSPVNLTYLPDLIGNQSRASVGHVDLRTVLAGADAIRSRIDEIAHLGNVIVVIDAATRDALNIILEAVFSMRKVPMLCGSAGLAYGLADHLHLAGGRRLTASDFEEEAAVPTPRPTGPALTIAGSIHPVTALQIETAAKQPGVTLCRLHGFALLDDRETHWQEEIDRATRVAVNAIRSGKDAIVALAPATQTDRTIWIDQTRRMGHGRDIVAELAGRLGELAQRILSDVQIGGLVLTGGETAGYVIRHLGGWGTRILDAVEDGIAQATLLGGPHDGLPLVIKPGAFGHPDALLTASRALKPVIKVSRSERPLLGITIGDPNGVGPEIIVKTLARPELYAICRPLVIGHAGVMKRNTRFAGKSLHVHSVTSPEQGLYQPGTIDVLDVLDLDAEALIPGTVQKEAGRLAVESVIRATQFAMGGEIQAIVTAPLNKEAMNLAGYHYPGHTELLAELTGTKRYRLSLATDGMVVSHVTTHVSLREAIDRLSEEGILTTIDIIGQALKRMGIEHPRIAVCGINPHAGEGGLFGDEEIRIIAPAVEKARAEGWNLLGPLPPDTVFMRARRGDFDGIVGMYHDQGHIPVKAVAFDRSVNVTLGLPIIRTSVDHGTAFDIAGKGIAKAENLDAAIEMAIRLIGHP